MFGRFASFETTQIIRTAAGLAVVAAGLLLARTAAEAGEPISVMIDRAKVMRIARPADTVILGNPAIADATIQDNQTLIITGSSFGSTNLIVLDADGQPIADELLTVQAPNDSVVTVYRRADRETLSLQAGLRADAGDRRRRQVVQLGQDPDPGPPLHLGRGYALGPAVRLPEGFREPSLSPHQRNPS